MINKVRIKFVIIVLSILFGVFAIFFGVACAGFDTLSKTAIKHNLAELTKTVIDKENDQTQFNAIVVKIYDKNLNHLVYNDTFDANLFTEQQVDYLVRVALSRPYPTGSIETIYYHMIYLETGETLLVASDMSNHLETSRSNMLNTLFILLVFYLILAIIVYGLSSTLFKPIKEAFNKQKQFVSNASHELKTPLSIISANAEVLKKSENNEWINNIQSQTQRMDTLITDMLTLAKMDEGKVERKKEIFNLSQLVLENALPFDAVAFENKKTIRLDITDQLTYTGDSSAVKNIVNILLDNAVKHAHKNSEIVLTLKKENGKITLSVFNVGSHIPNKLSNKIFERFYRGDKSRARASGGSGLGLAIAKHIADDNKWKIHAISKLGESMTITVTF